MTEKKTPAAEAEIAAAVETDFVKLMGAGWQRMEKLDAISKAIFQRIQEERAAEVQLGLALLKCPTPADAFVLYTKWVSERTSAFLGDGPRLAEMWTQLYLPKTGAAPPPVPE